MPKRRQELIRIAIPVVVTVALVLAWFAIFDRWHEIHDPWNSLATIVIAVSVFAVMVAIDIDLAPGRKRAKPDTSEHH